MNTFADDYIDFTETEVVMEIQLNQSYSFSLERKCEIHNVTVGIGIVKEMLKELIYHYWEINSHITRKSSLVVHLHVCWSLSNEI